MKVIRITIIILLSCSFLEASDALRGNLRKELFALNYNSEIAGELLIRLDYTDTPSPLIIAYKAVCEAHIAKVESNPFEKYRYLQKANKHLREAIDLDKKNVEIRFLRYAFQIQTPGILGFQRNLEEDRQVIMNDFTFYDWSGIDLEVIKYICDFMIEKGDCTLNERAQLLQFLAEKA